MKILKFGGSSIATVDRVRNVLNIITDLVSEQKIAVVISAFGGVTDKLIEMADRAATGDESYKVLYDSVKKKHIDAVKKLISVEDREPIIIEIKSVLKELYDTLYGVFLVRILAPKTLDRILSTGERLSANIIAASLQSRKINADYLDARKIIRTDSNFGSAPVDFDISNANIKSCFKSNSATQIVTGFIAANSTGDTTTLGRSGSDYTAAIIGAALNVAEIEIWTDVDGVMTANPSKVPSALSISSMTYEDAMEMSHFGAKVIFPPTIQPAMNLGIPIRIKNTFNPSFPGTVISRQSNETGSRITGISSMENIALIRVQGSGMIGKTGYSARIFQAIARKNISVMLITLASSEHSICIAVDPQNALAAKEMIEEEFALEIQVSIIDKVMIEDELSIVAVVGENMRHTPGISGKVFSALGDYGINIVAIAQGSSERNISIVVSKKDEPRTNRALHDAFFNTAKKIIDLYIIGTGLIGNELINLIQRYPKKNIHFRIKGLANSRKMLIDQSGIPLKSWNTVLNDSGNTMDLEDFIDQMLQLKGNNPVFVDCTASEAVARRYVSVLSNSISVVTPNKIANTLEWDEWLNIRQAALHSGQKFHYETSVGAGLPVISTLKNLIDSGDTILRIEAVLSGTISYIFNSLAENKTFSEIVISARDRGYTEPDPRNDLNGMDVACKLLSLVREIGYRLELNDVSVESLLMDGSKGKESTETFLKKLKHWDAGYEQRRSQAWEKGCVLRYIATVEKGKVDVGIKEVGKDHPFYSLSGSENIIAFYTNRYKNTPLVVRGPGAGAEVTASGVLVDIINCVK